MSQLLLLFLSDTTAVCILETFAHQPSMMLADKMLKEIGKERAHNKYKVNNPYLIGGGGEGVAHQPSMMLADKMIKEIDKERAHNKYKVNNPYLIGEGGNRAIPSVHWTLAQG